MSADIDVILLAGRAPPARALAVFPELGNLSPPMAGRIRRREVEPKPSGKCKAFTVHFCGSPFVGVLLAGQTFVLTPSSLLLSSAIAISSP